MTNIIIPRPTCGEVKKYLTLWSQLEDYPEQEKILNKFFRELYPYNNNFDHVLIKVAILNNFYSTRILSIYTVAKHIMDIIDIDNRLKNGDETLVDEIKKVKVKGKEFNYLSFATKYCSHHNFRLFPIYDSCVCKMLKHFRNAYHFTSFKNKELENYTRFKEIIKEFMGYYGFSSYFTFKDIDRYLWLSGKHFFPQKT